MIPIIPIIPKQFREFRLDSGKSISLLIIVEMFAIYQSLVLQDYETKRAANTLSSRLIHLTPAKLKAECGLVCTDRYLRKDEKTIKDFFDEGGDQVACLRAISRCEPDKFKPLVNFLRGSTSSTDEKNIELLAWLIEFEPRPYELGRKYDSISDIVQEKLPKAMPMQIISRRPTPNFRIRGVIIGTIVLVAIGFGVYWPRSNQSTSLALTRQGACMYWAGDHYQPIPCTQKLGDTLVIALDSEKLNHFKKITQPDTITARSKGMVWYIKINGNIEYYTSDGYHPTYLDLRLHPITEYMIRKYIHPNQEAGQVAK